MYLVQWERLGVYRFLLAYGAGLMQFRYKDSPLEKMAYFLQLDCNHSGGQVPAKGTVPATLVLHKFTKYRRKIL
ncbi:MAG: hypothetical protein D5S03_01735 [Desulfonatronospira sp. MSAO_Bac3]|nr:MAG: hypothetical protein D5S03_01735 [Desulfonatronospira sp. MSAO_Bac3]